MLRVGVAGLRRGARLFQMFAHHAEARVVAVCDADGARAEAFARAQLMQEVPAALDDFERLLEQDLDAVVIATPLPCHAAQSIAALERGKHVLCEVPAVASLAEAEALVAAARRSDAIYMMAENCCYNPFIGAWRQWVAEGRIGRIIYAEAEYVHDCRALMRDAAGRLTWRAAMPPIHYCTHSLGPLLWLNGDRCVSAVGMHPGVNVAPELGAIDMEVGLFRTAGGAVIKILCGFSVAREPSFHTYTVYGTRGCLEKPRDAEETRAFFADTPGPMAPLPWLPDAVAWSGTLPAHATRGGHGTSEYFLVNDFVNAVLHGAPVPIDVYTALDYTVPGLCAHLSAEEGGHPVAIPEYRRGAGD
jgi:predicted dehydrogenase